MKPKEIQLPGRFEFGSLEWISRQLANGFMSGYHRSPYHGFSVEFAEHRPYYPGESIRYVDWKVYARTEKLLIKKYEEETNLRCRILIDTSSSMYYPLVEDEYLYPANPSKIQFSILAAASLIHLFKSQRDSFSITFFDEKVYQDTTEGTSALHLRTCFDLLKSALSRPISQAAKTTKLPEVLHQLAETAPRHSLLILFSDLILSDQTDFDELVNAVNHLKFNRIDLLVFHIVHRKTELEFDFETDAPLLLVDLESGREIKVSPLEAREMYQKQIQRQIKKLHSFCIDAGMDIHLSVIENGYYQVLSEYLKKRSKK
ncbi:DUF58 domain-containing protein [Schleiferia thermophila]|uniref:Uncharacterized protein DUF58 n=1 Tax=Schleiferia thermophila TaxID=884107 RepID=A0A369ACY7_9FLAO|nr:DUF58 domain-containing protein [Schleiferia thermophila]KFD39890.1 hypothetical protein AT05_00225 [Schleiferia thermophila str. Yellowstone]RCX05284.1 uncharacterized protein DUF58 [Schleiferia thermophila]GCD79206.1 hypothetical protein JCM30197_04530 [Schleiferia thermophila]